MQMKNKCQYPECGKPCRIKYCSEHGHTVHNQRYQPQGDRFKAGYEGMILGYNRDNDSVNARQNRSGDFASRPTGMDACDFCIHQDHKKPKGD